MSQIHSLINCPDLQDQLNRFGLECDPTKIREALVLQDWVYSPSNGIGGRMNRIGGLTSPGQGKSRIVELIYSPRILTSEVQENTGRDNCTNTNIIGETSTTYDVGDNYLM